MENYSIWLLEQQCFLCDWGDFSLIIYKKVPNLGLSCALRRHQIPFSCEMTGFTVPWVFCLLRRCCLWPRSTCYTPLPSALVASAEGWRKKENGSHVLAQACQVANGWLSLIEEWFLFRTGLLRATKVNARRVSASSCRILGSAELLREKRPQHCHSGTFSVLYYSPNLSCFTAFNLWSQFVPHSCSLSGTPGCSM